MGQSKVTYTGLTGASIFGGYGKLTRGVRADSFVIYLSTGTYTFKDGDLTFTDDGTAESFTLVNCVADHSYMTPPHSSRGNYWIKARVKDRRERWRYQHGQAEYNVRNTAGEVEEWSKATCKEIIESLLDAMDEGTVDTTAVTEAVYPYLKYNGPPAYALEEVCARCGYDVVLKANNSIQIVQLGSGVDNAVTAGYIDPPSGVQKDVPTKIEIVGGPTTWQSLLDCEVVGEDVDGKVISIDSLSYAPTTGFTGEQPQLYMGVDASVRWLAFKTVHRWFRVLQIHGSGLTPPGASETGTEIDQIFPLIVNQVVTGASTAGTKNIATPVLSGTFYPYTDHPYNTGTFREYAGDFWADCRNGIVKTDRAVYQLTGGCPSEAEMYLLTAHRFRRASGEYDRWIAEVEPIGGATGAVQLSHPELFKVIRQEYDYTGTLTETTDNETELQAEADALLNSWQTALSEPVPHRVRTAIGIRSVECTGTISAVEWSAGRRRVGSTKVHVGTCQNYVANANKYQPSDDAPVENTLCGDKRA